MITEKDLDILIQQIASMKLSQVSKQKNCIGHHIIHRANKLFRWDLDNIVFLTEYEHRLVHAVAGYEDDILTLEQKIYKEKNNNRSFKQYLLLAGITEQDFLEAKYKQLTTLYPINKYELFLKNKEINGIATYSKKLKEKKELDRLKYFAEKDRKVKLRELKPKRKILQLAKDYNHNLYLKAKEKIRDYKNNLKLKTN